LHDLHRIVQTNAGDEALYICGGERPVAAFRDLNQGDHHYESTWKRAALMSFSTRSGSGVLDSYWTAGRSVSDGKKLQRIRKLEHAFAVLTTQYGENF
jgi:hypothetical protein